MKDYNFVQSVQIEFLDNSADKIESIRDKHDILKSNEGAKIDLLKLKKYINVDISIENRSESNQSTFTKRSMIECHLSLD